jgi:hypothetical protein
MTIGMVGAPVFAAGQASAYGPGNGPAYESDPAPAYNSVDNVSSPANPGNATPGTVNYVEGSVRLDGNPLARRDVGQASMQPGEVLSTATGKAEILLTPGVFLRLDDQSAVKMIAPDLTQTQVELDKGRAAVEVDQIFPQNNLQIMDSGVTTQLLKPGFYEFNANQPEAMVFKGRAEVNEGGNKWKEVKDHHEVNLVAGADMKSISFNTDHAEDGLYNWSSLRSQYLSEANGQIAGQYAGVSSFVPGWYWDPYMWDYTFIGMGPYWSPFGFGFYPPWGWYGGFWHGGLYGRGFRGRGFAGRGLAGHGFAGRGIADRGFAGGGFHGGFGGGGFHGGSGGGRR